MMPRSFLRIFVAVTLLLLVLGASAIPSGLAAEPGGPTTFQAGQQETPADPNDPLALLARCDNLLEQCKTDHVGMPYLVAAYLALWAILLGYFVLTRRGQQKLESEIQELRLRLRDYEEQFLQDESKEEA